MRRLYFLSIPILALCLAGCTVGPKYKRPVVNAPATYRGPAENQSAQASPKSLGDEKWWTIFQDQELQKLIRTALERNYDVQIAASRVTQAQEQVRINRADQFPTVNGGAQIFSQRQVVGSAFPPFEVTAGQLNLSAAWNLDFWGRYRRATEAARAQLVATEWGRRATLSSLVANVAQAYFQLREFDLELEIARRTLASRQESLKLTQTLADGGATSILDVRQAQQLVETAAQAIPDLERQIQQQENLLSILLGQNPGEIARGQKLTEQLKLPTVPAGLPSALLERRPDILQAEYQLVASNARIGAAKAAYFPQISLTGSTGLQSNSLTNLFTDPGGIWNISGALTQPIFTAGKLRANVRLTEAQKQEMLLTYQKAIQQAFRDVSDSLIAYEKNRQFREHQASLTKYAEDAARLSDVRYKGGATSYLEVLTSQTNYFAAELNLARAQLNEMRAMVQIYNALGGGWEQ